jgi:hypothetical protein
MILYAATVALSAFLLFLVQPIIAREILPWFGGSAAVWTTCMVFFQVALLAGYFYSDTVIRRLAPRRQALLHTVLLLASLAFLPIGPGDGFKPADASNPIGRILLLLTATIGLPFLMLATTGPLVQAWFARSFRQAQVYRLYALSNLASMLALIAYPPLIEPNASSRAQAVGWSVAYTVFAVLAIAAAWYGVRRGASSGRGMALATVDAHAEGIAAPPEPASAITLDEAIAAASAGVPSAAGRQAGSGASAGSGAGAGPGGGYGALSAGPPTLAEQGLWLVLAALGSMLLLSVTSHITQNVASVPFLWVLPLSVYLITFILCFDGKGWYWRPQYFVLASVLAVLMIGGLSWSPRGMGVERGLLPIDEAVPLYAFGLFVCCMFLHGELVTRKPAPAHLTRFYLMISLGGAVGGLLVGIVAPLVFVSYWELPLALLAVAVLVGALASGGLRAVGTAAVVACAALFGDYVTFVRFDAVELSRNFYGTLRVKVAFADDEKLARRRLLHGVILHGEQFDRPDWRRLPTTYYGVSSGIGRTIETMMPTGPLRVGLIGLGIGTLATYGREGDVYRLYELNPEVLDLAQRRFTFLADSRATIEPALGDARLVLEREPPQRLDVLAVDAFSSDSIPVHLLTREAMQVYRRHLASGGAIAFHISNRFLDLSGVVRQLADEVGMAAVRLLDDPGPDHYLYRSDWIVVTGNRALIDALREQGGVDAPRRPGLRPWTDDHHNLFQVLK